LIGEDLKLVEEETLRITKEKNAFRADQFQLQGNFRAHYLHTGPEIIEQMGDLSIDAFVDFAGTGGTFGGVSSCLKERCTFLDSTNFLIWAFLLACSLACLLGFLV